MNKVGETVFEVIKDVAGVEEIQTGDLLKEDLGLDSLTLVEVFVRLEEEFSFEFDSDNLNPDEILWVEDLIALVEKSL